MSTSSLSEQLWGRSILWMAVLHSVIIAALIVGVFTALSYNFNQALIEQYFLQRDIDALLVSATNLTRLQMIAGGLMLLASILLAFLLAQKLTLPLLEIAEKVQQLKPDNWSYRQTIATGDELEELDQGISNLTNRLRKVYLHLEEEVDARSHELEQEYAKDRAILHSISHGLLVVDTKGKILEANPAAAAILIYTPQDLIHKSVFEVLDVHEHQNLVDEEHHPVMQCLRSHRPFRPQHNVHMSITTAAGDTVAVRISVSPLMENDSIHGAIVLFQDVTSERQVDYMKTEFITLASHQLRTPLATAQWYMELLSAEEASLSQEQRSFIVELRMAIHRMNNIVSELMDASRLRKNGVDPVLEAMDLRLFIANITEEMQALANAKKVTCKAIVPKEALMHKTDPMLLSVVMQNLVSNAIKYSYLGGTVKVSLEGTPHSIKIHVQDDGMGIPEDEQNRVFQKMFRAHNVRKHEVNGSGLGLYSSKMIVDKLGGEITFSSKENKGSVFSVVFPRREGLLSFNQEAPKNRSNTKNSSGRYLKLFLNVRPALLYAGFCLVECTVQHE